MEMVTPCLPKNVGDLVDRKWRTKPGESSLKIRQNARLSGRWFLGGLGGGIKLEKEANALWL